jgi:hypothetical protein
VIDDEFDTQDASGLDVRAANGAAEREQGGYRFHLYPADAAKLRELAGARGKSDETLIDEFLSAQAPRWAQSLADTLPPPADVRVVVDPYSRQAFLASGRTVFSILSF